MIILSNELLYCNLNFDFEIKTAIFKTVLDGDPFNH